MRFHRLISKLLSQSVRNRSETISKSLINSFISRRPFSQLHSRPSFGIAFDIDGVILRGNTVIGGSSQALKRLYDDSGALKIPYVFLTNGGGVPESKRAIELSGLLGVNILESQVIQGHSPFKQLATRFENDFIVAVGKGEPAKVMSEYGFKNVLSIDDYAACFEHIDPLAPYKKWNMKQGDHKFTSKICPSNDICSERVKAVFIVSDPIDWSRDIQVLCDILRTGGLPGREIGDQPPLYFAHDDLKYQATFPSERFGLGAFRIALESVYNSVHPVNLKYTSYGKPNAFVFHHAEFVLRQLISSNHGQNIADPPVREMHEFKRLYMIGDNPAVDIKGAQQVVSDYSTEDYHLQHLDVSHPSSHSLDQNLPVRRFYFMFQAGHTWFSILTRTGVFKGYGNHTKFPADHVVKTVEDAVDYILKLENYS